MTQALRVTCRVVHHHAIPMATGQYVDFESHNTWEHWSQLFRLLVSCSMHTTFCLNCPMLTSDLWIFFNGPSRPLIPGADKKCDSKRLPKYCYLGVWCCLFLAWFATFGLLGQAGVGYSPFACHTGDPMKDIILLAACRNNEMLPQDPELPADVFTSCLTTPLKVCGRTGILFWYCCFQMH